MLFEEINRLQKMDRLIRLSNTGNADEFGEKLGLSRRQVYNIIENLKDMGLEIEYNRQIKSFVYAKPYKVKVLFEIVELSECEKMEINAGTVIVKNTFMQEIICRLGIKITFFIDCFILNSEALLLSSAPLRSIC